MAKQSFAKVVGRDVFGFPRCSGQPLSGIVPMKCNEAGSVTAVPWTFRDGIADKCEMRADTQADIISS